MNIRLFVLSIVIILAFYFIPRVGWSETIEFGYDQPQLATIIYDYIEHGSYMTSQAYSQLTPWGYLSWGPALTIFFVPFFLLTPDVTTISLLFATFNALSIVVVVYMGWRYFNPLVGIIAGFFLAAQPWWVLFSRMIYSPSPTATLAAFIMLVTFGYLEKPRSILISILMFLWAAAIQFYLNAFSIILPSFVVVCLKMKRSFSLKYTTLGILAVFFLFLPSVVYYRDNPDLFYGFFSVDKDWESRATPLVDRLQFSLGNYLAVLSGGGFSYQLGTAESAFNADFSYQKPFQIALLGLVSIILIYSTAVLFRKELVGRWQRLLLLVWVLGPAWFLFLVKTPHIVPRYYLVCLPALALLTGLFFTDLMNYLSRYPFPKLRFAVLIIPLIIVAWWSYFIVRYYTFILAYEYPTGFISHTSDTPYSFLQSAFDWILQDSVEHKYDQIVLSSDRAKPDQFAQIHAVEYYWKEVLKRDYSTPTGEHVGYYMLEFSPAPPEIGQHYVQFGPYVVYRNELVHQIE